MKSQSDHTFKLEDGDRPGFTQHGEDFSIHLASYMGDGAGFTLRIPYAIHEWFLAQAIKACERAAYYREQIHGDPPCEPDAPDDMTASTTAPAGPDPSQ